MELVKVKIETLSGRALDWAVAKFNIKQWGHHTLMQIENCPMSYSCRPSSKWQEGGQIIERELIEFKAFSGGSKGFRWEACMYIEDDEAVHQFGDTALIAAMRVYVKAKCQDNVIAVPEGVAK